MTPIEFVEYQKTHRHTVGEMSIKTEKFGLTPMEAGALAVADKLTMMEIAKELEVTLPQVTALANKLLHLKLVTSRIQLDRRSRRLHVTAKGKAVLAKLEEA